MNAQEWTTAFAQRLGVAAPTEAEFEQLLALAGIAAHASERVAAPVSCWVAATAGVPIEAALAAAREVSADE
jgi:hypothetical protein